MYVLRSKKSELWRPMYVAVVLAAMVFVGMLVIGEIDPSATPGVALTIAGFVLLVGLVRVLNWWFTAGRTMVRVDENVLVRGRSRTVRIEPREIASALILPGEWRSEWSRWAVHPQIVLELRNGKRISRKILLDAQGVLREGPRLHAAIVEAAGKGDEETWADSPMETSRSWHPGIKRELIPGRPASFWSRIFRWIRYIWLGSIVWIAWLFVRHFGEPAPPLFLGVFFLLGASVIGMRVIGDGPWERRKNAELAARYSTVFGGELGVDFVDATTGRVIRLAGEPPISRGEYRSRLAAIREAHRRDTTPPGVWRP